MALTFTAGTSVESTGSVTSTTVTLPAGLASGDYTIIVVSLNSSSGVITTPSGWTNILANTDSVNGSTSDHHAIFYRKWVSGDADPAVTTASGRVAATPIRVQGADATTFVDVAATVTQSAAAAATQTAPSITPTSGWLVCTFNGRDASSNITQTPYTSLSASMTKIAEASGISTSTNAGHCIAYEAVTPNTATGTRQVNPQYPVDGGMGVSFSLNAATTDTDYTFDPSDSEGLTDSLSTVNNAVRSPADAEGLVDSLTATRGVVRVQADAEGITDSVATVNEAVRAQADAEGLTDALATANAAVRSPADAMGVMDTLATTMAADRTLADPAGWTDGVASVRGAARVPADPLGMTDSLAIQWDRAAVVADPLGLTDTATGSSAGAGSSTSADQLGLTDGLTAAADRSRTIADGLGFTDSLTRVNNAVRAPADPLGLADSVTEVNGNDRTGTDAAGLTDSVSATFGLGRSPADSVGLADSLTVTWNRSATVGDSLGLADVATPSGSALSLRDLVLGAAPLPDRFTAVPLVPGFDANELGDRFMSVSLAGRWSVVRLEGEPMRKEVLVSAGAVEYVGGTVTEVTGKDISAAVFKVSLGGPTNPGAWVDPTVSTAGTTSASRVLKLLVNNTTAKGTYYAWARISDSPEVAPVRFPQEIIVR